MNFNLLRESFLPALQTVNSVVDRRQNLPILSNILLKLHNDQLTMTATDMEVEMVCNIPGNYTATGAITVPARKFLDICRSLPEGSDIQFESTEAKLLIKSGKSRFTLQTLPAQEFPESDFQNPKSTFELTQATFKALLEDTQFAMAQQDVRYYLNGLLLELEKDRLRAVATDGHRLALKDLSMDVGLGENLQVILPRKTVQELVKVVQSNDDPITVSVASNQIRFTIGNTVITSKLIDGKFPDYQRVIPEATDRPLVADRELLIQGLNRASILSNEKYRGVRVTIAENNLKAEAQNPEQEQAEEQIEAQYTGPEVEIGFNVSYLLDAIAAIKTESVKLLIFDANSSCLILPTDESTCKYVVMPMRL